MPNFHHEGYISNFTPVISVYTLFLFKHSKFTAFLYTKNTAMAAYFLLLCMICNGLGAFSESIRHSNPNSASLHQVIKRFFLFSEYTLPSFR